MIVLSTVIWFCRHDDRGHSGIEYVVEVASQLLEPGRSEFSALLIGRLISTLVHKAGQYLSGAIEPLLRSVLSKLQQAQTQSVIQVKCHCCVVGCLVFCFSVWLGCIISFVICSLFLLCLLN